MNTNEYDWLCVYSMPYHQGNKERANKSWKAEKYENKSKCGKGLTYGRIKLNEDSVCCKGGNHAIFTHWHLHAGKHSRSQLSRPSLYICTLLCYASDILAKGKNKRGDTAVEINVSRVTHKPTTQANKSAGELPRSARNVLEILSLPFVCAHIYFSKQMQTNLVKNNFYICMCCICYISGKKIMRCIMHNE